MGHLDSNTCREVEPLFAAYVDGEAAPADSAAVQAHVSACPPCQAQLDAERAARELVRARARELCGCAPSSLKVRCAPSRDGGVPFTSRPARRVLVPLSMAAAAILVVGATVFIAFGARVEAALATQLTLDHLKCFSTPKTTVARGTAPQIEQALKQQYALDIPVPPGCPAQALRLVGAKRCIYSDGRMAHLMYEHEGRPLSMYVMFDGGRPERIFEIMGHEAFIWSAPQRTYALVGQESPGVMNELAQYMRSAAAEGAAACR